MYQPAHHREDRLEVQHQLIREHPFGLLITAGPSGLLANPVPFTLEVSLGVKGTIRTHLARPNAQWRELDGEREALVVFQGPQAYVTPSWYPSKSETGKAVPTWNYVTVQVRGRARAVEDGDWLRAQIDVLTRQHEEKRAVPWEVSDAPNEFIDQLVRVIVGVEIEIMSIEGKWKVSQNRPEADRYGVHAGFKSQGAEAMAALVAERGGITKGGVA